MSHSIINSVTIDVEDYFHPTEVANHTQGKSWDSFPSRVVDSTHRVLDLLAEAHETKGTFFILGWVAQKFPCLVREILAGGHEVACHSFYHRLVCDLTPAEFRADTLQAVRCIEDAGGVSPKAYRAPSYSITSECLWALEVLADLGFTHDSSIYPIVHDRYGIPNFGRHSQNIDTPSGKIFEVPAATVRLLAARIAPVGGGGYLRLLPYRYTSAGLRRLNQQEGQPACIYFHPWEVDPDQPRIALGFLASCRTYVGLAGMQGKLQKLLSEFRFSTLESVFPCEVIRTASV